MMESSGGEAECSDSPQPQSPGVAVGNQHVYSLTQTAHHFFHLKTYEHQHNHYQEVILCRSSVTVILYVILRGM